MPTPILERSFIIIIKAIKMFLQRSIQRLKAILTNGYLFVRGLRATIFMSIKDNRPKAYAPIKEEQKG